MAWPPAAADALPHQCGLGIRLRRQRRPDQAAAPVVDHVAAGFARQTLARARRPRPADRRSATPARRRARPWPRTARRRERTPRPPPRPHLRRFRPPRTATAALASEAARWAADAVMPSSRSSVTACPRRSEPAERAGRDRATPISGTCAAPETSNGEPSAAVIARLAVDIVEPAQHQRALALRPRHHLQRHFGHDRERAPGPRQQLAEIVAGDVLHDPAAGLETVAEAGHRLRAKQMVAGAAGLDAARTGEAGADHAADGAGRRRAQQRRGVDRLERKMLILRNRSAT